MDRLKRLAGRPLVERIKQIVDAESLVRSTPFHEAFPSAPTQELSPEVEIPFGSIAGLHVTEENRIDAERGVYRRPPLYTADLEQALICPSNNVVMNEDREVVKDSINMGGRSVYGLDRQKLCRNRIDEIDGPATLLRGPATGYWHGQLDNIPRVSLLRNERHRRLPRIKLLRPAGGPSVNRELENDLVPKIAPSNCEIVDLPPDRLFRVHDYVFIPFLTFPFSAHLPDFFLNIVKNNILPDRPRQKSKRIFISRKKASRRNIVNEDELYDLLHEYGFERYFLEDMTIDAKVQLFYDAEAVVSPTSSGLASLLYTRGIPVVELFPTPKITNPANHFLSESVDNTHFYIPHDGASTTSDFRANLDAVRNTLDAIGLPRKQNVAVH